MQGSSELAFVDCIFIGLFFSDSMFFSSPFNLFPFDTCKFALILILREHLHRFPLATSIVRLGSQKLLRYQKGRDPTSCVKPRLTFAEFKEAFLKLQEETVLQTSLYPVCRQHFLSLLESCLLIVLAEWQELEVVDKPNDDAMRPFLPQDCH